MKFKIHIIYLLYLFFFHCIQNVTNVEKNKRITHYMFTKSEVATLYIMSTNYRKLHVITLLKRRQRSQNVFPHIRNVCSIHWHSYVNKFWITSTYYNECCSVLLASKNLPIIYTTYASVFNDIGHTLSKSS